MPVTHTRPSRPRWRWLKLAATLLSPAMLAACFVSETPLIPLGEAVLPVDGSINMCVERNDPCFEMAIEGDTYVSVKKNEDNEGGRARFAPLVAVSGRQVFILEAFDESEPGYLYILARRARNPGAGDATFDLAAIDCEDLTEEAMDAWLAAGGSYKRGFVSECQSPDLATLRAALIASLSEELEDEDWWEENGPS